MIMVSDCKYKKKIGKKMKKIGTDYQTSFKSTISHPENIQCQTERISLGLFLNLDFSGKPHLSEPIFSIYINSAKRMSY